ncbi:hypothetical protein CY34DRAFT_801522 [Suillus luteus UH-Slu-Lm8-n1]|uniref:Secreted protein n=1 Tax=Suillus luteus UH-Slu-Lm8-n1 TaxID=930992 RepID=A0A0D0AUX8_9AGAM|nr:hypothetical protein CY34DRAFT_801522 [Suillus luteus UH-Slu-Lm8-n1]
MVTVRIILQTLIMIHTSVGGLTQSPEHVVSNKQLEVVYTSSSVSSRQLPQQSQQWRSIFLVPLTRL